MLRTESLHTLEELATIREEWTVLHDAARPGTPFEHPAWARTWAQRFVPNGALECVVVRDTAQGDSLVGFAPLYQHRFSLMGVTAVAIQPLGTGRRQAVTEVAQVLCRPGRSSEIIRAVLRHLEGLPQWNWLQISLSLEQGWLVPQWLERPGEHLISHRNVRPCVVVQDLPLQPEELLGQLKRNVRESIRRGRNRTRELGGVSFRQESGEPELSEALDSLARLHRERSSMPGKMAHVDVLAQAEEREFLLEAVRLLAKDGLARVHLAAHRGEDVAALLVLSDGHTDYVSLSGLDPRYWELNLSTLLIFEALLDAAREGRVGVNLSSGPDVAKLRWSTKLALYNDFIVARGNTWSRLLYGAYSHWTLMLRHRQEWRRHELQRLGKKLARY